MSKFGSGITRLLFGLGKKEMKVIPYNEMSPEQFEQLDRFLGKVGFAVANDTVSLTQRQQEYILNQIKQLDLYRKNMMRDPDLVRVDKMTELKDPDFKGFKPKVIEGGKGKSQTPVKDKIESQLGGIKLRGDETFSEIEFIRRFKKHPRDVLDVPRRPADFDTYPYEEQVDIDIDNENVYKDAVERALEDGEYAGGGLVALIEKLRKKFGKKAITTADKVDRPARAKLKQEFDDFTRRNMKTKEGRFTKSEVLIQRLKNTLKDSYGKTDPESRYAVENFPNFIKELEADPSLADNPKVFEALGGDLPDNQRFVEYSDGSLDFYTKGGPGGMKSTKELSDRLGIELEEAIKIKQMEPEDQILEIKRRETLRDKKAGGGLATMFRPKLKDGGPPNPGRRTFLKLMGGLASIPIIGKIFKPAAKVSNVVPLKNTTTQMPSWFPNFVDKMMTKNVGEKIDADIMMYKDKDLPGVTLYRNDDGRITVNGQNEYYAEYEIDYTPPGYEVIDEAKNKAVKTPGDFQAVDADPITDYDGSIADYEPRTLESVDGLMSSDARRMEGYAKDIDPEKIPLKPGEGSVIENEVRAEAAMDAAREAEDYVDDFADGGLATMFRKK